MSADKILSEVYNVVIALGKDYKSRIADDVWDTIEKERNLEYSPFIDVDKRLGDQDISRESISMIALLYRDYWCNSAEEHERFLALLKSNEEKEISKLEQAGDTRELLAMLKKNSDSEM